MVFKDCDEGPFWLSDAERLSSRFDSETISVTQKNNIKSELFVQLRDAGYDTAKKRYLNPELVTICNTMSLPTTVEAKDITLAWSTQRDAPDSMGTRLCG